MTLSLARAVSSKAFRPAPSSPRRHTSNSSSAKYLNVFQRKQFDFYEEMGGEKFPLRAFPELISRTLETESVMLGNGKQCLIHSSPATLRPAVTLVTRLSLLTINPDLLQRSPFCQKLRTQVYTERELDQHMVRIEKMKQDGDEQPDFHPEVRLSLLSTNYGFLSNPIKNESAAYYIARNRMADEDMKKAIWIAAAMIREALQLHGFSEGEIDEITKEYLPLLEGYMNLPLGDLYILGIPNAILPRIAYDSKAFGIPTYKNPQEVLSSLDSCSRLMADGGHQARVVLNKNVLHATDGIDVVYANDSQQVKKYVKGYALTPPEEVEIFSPLNLSKNSQVEEEYRGQKRILDTRCEALEAQILKRAREFAQR